FMRAIEREKPACRFDRLLCPLIFDLRFELRLERAGSACAKLLAALVEPPLERLFIDGDALQQLAAIEIERLADHGERTATDQSFEPRYIDINIRHVQRDTLAADEQRAWCGGLQHTPHVMKRMAQAIPRMLIAHTAPQQGG